MDSFAFSFAKFFFSLKDNRTWTETELFIDYTRYTRKWITASLKQLSIQYPEGRMFEYI